MSSQIKIALERCKSALVYVFVFSLFVNLLMLTVPIFMLLTFDYVLTSFSRDTLIFLSLIAIMALGIMGALDVIRGFIMRRVAYWFEHQLASDALKRAVENLLLGNPYGTQSINDLANIRTFLTSPSVFSLFDVPWMPIYIAVIFMLHPILGYFSVIGALVLIALGYINQVSTKKLLHQATKDSIENQKNIDLAMRNVEVIQAMGMMDSVINRWNTKQKDTITAHELSSDRIGVITSISKFFRLTLQLGVLALGAFLVIQEQLTPGGMIAASILLSRALAPAEQSIGVWRQLINVRESYARIIKHFSSTVSRGTGIDLPKPSGILTLEKVTYGIKGMSRPIIDNVSFSVQPGEILALIGPSGAGKTTLARLMVGILKPQHGVARLDGADVFQWERRDFGKHVGYLPQDIELLPGSIRDNIARMSSGDDALVLSASKLVGAHDFILQMAKAYDSEITLTHNPLSGGQQQRIGLARAYYGTPSLVVLDEPGSNLDSDGQKALFASMNALRKKGVTIIIITHHLPSLKMVDKIAVLANGKLITYGPREQILRNMNEAANTAKRKDVDA